MSTTYLLFIDEIPVSEDLKNYFAQFNIKTVQQSTLPPIFKTGMPLALLIHWSILRNQIQTIHQLYANHLIPLLIINDFPDEETCIKVLEEGADDFIVKPIHPRELHARLSTINRRVLSAQKQSNPEKVILMFDNWRIYPASRRVFNENNNHELLLSAGEYDLLLTFIQQPQQVLDREFLLQVTKNSDTNPLDRKIDVQISRLRQKIEHDVKNPLLIKTIRNGGYIFTAPVKNTKETAERTDEE